MRQRNEKREGERERESICVRVYANVDGFHSSSINTQVAC